MVKDFLRGCFINGLIALVLVLRAMIGVALFNGAGHRGTWRSHQCSSASHRSLSSVGTKEFIVAMLSALVGRP